MTLSTALLVLDLLFGTPEASFRARVYQTLVKMCPATAPARQVRYARVTADVALERDDPETAAKALLGILAHETFGATERQAGGGPAVGAWQVEVQLAHGVPREDAEWERFTEREMLVADPHAAARAALRVLDGCKGSLRCYAGAGAKHTPRADAIVAQLEACVAVAGKGMDQRDGVGPCKTWYREPKKYTRAHPHKKGTQR